LIHQYFHAQDFQYHGRGILICITSIQSPSLSLSLPPDLRLEAPTFASQFHCDITSSILSHSLVATSICIISSLSACDILLIHAISLGIECAALLGAETALSPSIELDDLTACVKAEVTTLRAYQPSRNLICHYSRVRQSPSRSICAGGWASDYCGSSAQIRLRLGEYLQCSGRTRKSSQLRTIGHDTRRLAEIELINA
jgi:hypothetical protein